VKGQTLTILGGTEQQYVNSLMANLQATPFRNAAQPTFPNYPAMLGTTTQGLPEGAKRIAPLVPVMPATTVGETQTEQVRTRPYRGGIMGVLNQVVAPSALAQQIRAIGSAEGYRRGTHAGEETGAAAYRAGYTVRQTAGTAATLTLPEIETRLAAGEVLRPTGGRPRVVVGGGGGGGAAAAVQAVAEEAAPK
jgi:hypothetical protein